MQRKYLTTSIIATKLTLVASGILFMAGCDPSPSNPGPTSTPIDSTVSVSELPPDSTNEPAKSSTPPTEEHGHKPGQHGGIMVSLGRDSYHIEAVIADDGTVRLYTLGNDESRVIDIESQSLKGYVKKIGSSDSKQIEFEPTPQDGDPPNRTSLFAGKLPEDLVGAPLDLTVPNIRISGERFRLGFQSVTESHASGANMPDAIGVDEERELYLVPQGRYTQADIDKNGKTVPSIKFKGIRSAHDMSPKSGDKVCPITETKANASFTWAVDGNEYQFCCPPCVDEFVRMAKESSDPLPTPDVYVKK